MDLNLKDFNETIDLGREEDISMCCESPKKGKKKTRMYYPSLYINNVDGIKDLPKGGYALIKYKRTNLNLSLNLSERENEEGEDEERMSADLEIQAISFPKESKKKDEMSVDEIFESMGASMEEGKED